MKQRIPALVTALTLLLPLPLSVRAADYTETDSGGVSFQLREGRFQGFILITDESVTQEAIEEVKGVYEAAPLDGDLYRQHEFSEEIAACYSGYGVHVRLWLVTIKPAYMEILLEYGQDFSVHIDGALDAVWMDYADYGYGYWNGSFSTAFPAGISPDAQQLSQQLAVEARAAAFQEEWHSAVTAWEESLGEKRMSPAAYKAARQAAGLLTDHEAALAGETYAAEILALYNESEDVQCRLDFTIDSTKRKCDGASVWKGIGDWNLDRRVDAQDAAEVLKYAAEQGVGQEKPYLEQQINAGDTNRDNILNASDASMILLYAARAGSGETVSWAELIRGKE